MLIFLISFMFLYATNRFYLLAIYFSLSRCFLLFLAQELLSHIVSYGPYFRYIIESWIKAPLLSDFLASMPRLVHS